VYYRLGDLWKVPFGKDTQAEIISPEIRGSEKRDWTTTHYLFSLVSLSS